MLSLMLYRRYYDPVSYQQPERENTWKQLIMNNSEVQIHLSKMCKCYSSYDIAERATYTILFIKTRALFKCYISDQ